MSYQDGVDESDQTKNTTSENSHKTSRRQCSSVVNYMTVHDSVYLLLTQFYKSIICKRTLKIKYFLVGPFSPKIEKVNLHDS